MPYHTFPANSKHVSSPKKGSAAFPARNTALTILSKTAYSGPSAQLPGKSPRCAAAPSPLAIKAAYRKSCQQLETARELAFQAHQTALVKDRLLSDMSHEIRSALHAVLGFTELAELAYIKGDTSLTARHMQKARQSSSHLLHLLDNILDFSRMENGSVKLSKEPFQLSLIIGQLLDCLQPEILRKQLQVTKDLQLRHDYLLGDSLRLQQILTNIMTNAVKYTPETGHIILQVSEKSSPCQFNFTISDTGVGMSEAFLQKIFLPYERAAEAGSLAQGSGLGMAITAELVSLMGGHILISSKEKKGTTVVVTLPFQTL